MVLFRSIKCAYWIDYGYTHTHTGRQLLKMTNGNEIWSVSVWLTMLCRYIYAYECWMQMIYISK